MTEHRRLSSLAAEPRPSAAVLGAVAISWYPAASTAWAGNRHIRQAITEIEAEVAAINTRLSDLSAGVSPTRSRR